MYVQSTTPEGKLNGGTLSEANVIIRRVSPFDSNIVSAIGTFRVKVWQLEGQKIDSNLIADGKWIDKLDTLATSQHWVVFVNGELAAASRISFHETFANVPDYTVFQPYRDTTATIYSSLNRMVVHPRYQGLGLGSLLDTIRIQTAYRQGAGQVFAYAVGTTRARSLIRKGFVKKTTNHQWSVYPENEGPFHALVIDRYAMKRSHTHDPKGIDKLLEEGVSSLALRENRRFTLSTGY